MLGRKFELEEHDVLLAEDRICGLVDKRLLRHGNLMMAFFSGPKWGSVCEVVFDKFIYCHNPVLIWQQFLKKQQHVNKILWKLWGDQKLASFHTTIVQSSWSLMQNALSLSSQLRKKPIIFCCLVNVLISGNKMPHNTN